MVKEVKILEVHVDKGMRHGQKITFGGEADQAPGVEPGDIVLVLQEKDHEVRGTIPVLTCHTSQFPVRSVIEEMIWFFWHVPVLCQFLIISGSLTLCDAVLL